MAGGIYAIFAKPEQNFALFSLGLYLPLWRYIVVAGGELI